MVESKFYSCLHMGKELTKTMLIWLFTIKTDIINKGYKRFWILDRALSYIISRLDLGQNDMEEKEVKETRVEQLQEEIRRVLYGTEEYRTISQKNEWKVNVRKKNGAAASKTVKKNYVRECLRSVPDEKWKRMLDGMMKWNRLRLKKKTCKRMMAAVNEVKGEGSCVICIGKKW